MTRPADGIAGSVAHTALNLDEVILLVLIQNHTQELAQPLVAASTASHCLKLTTISVSAVI